MIAWNAGKDPTKTHLAIANFTGSLRLLVGLGWPMIYFVAAAFGWRERRSFIAVELDDEHSVEVFGLLLPILYFVFIWWKGTLIAVGRDSAHGFVLRSISGSSGRSRRAKENEEALEDLGVVPRTRSVARSRGCATPRSGRCSSPAARSSTSPRIRSSNSMLAIADVARRLDVRLRAVGGAVPLRVPGEAERLLLGAQSDARPTWR